MRTSNARTFAAVVASVLLAFPGVADALGDKKQILIGGNVGEGSQVLWTAPGLGVVYEHPSNVPAHVQMPKGRVGRLRAAVITDGTATSGSVTVTVTVNAENTALSCTVSSLIGGTCETPKKTWVHVSDGQFLAVKVTSTLDQGEFTFNYSMIYD